MSSAEPVTGTERILQAAIDLFGRDGIRATSLKAIAEQAGVSPALVVHHFKSKDGLRAACEERTVHEIRRLKTEAMGSAGPGLIPIPAAGGIAESKPLLRFLARLLVEGSPHLDQLLDDLVDDALDYTQEAIDAGLVRPSQNPRNRMVVLTLWSLGTLVLHRQMKRMLDVDLLGEDGDFTPYMDAALEIFTTGIFTPDARPPIGSQNGTP